jgi:hypothetical protein
VKRAVRELVDVETVSVYLPTGSLRPPWRRLSMNERMPASADCVKRTGAVLAQPREPAQRISIVTDVFALTRYVTLAGL